MIFVSVAAKLNSPERTQDLRKLLDKMRATGDLCPLSPLNGSPTWARTRDLRINSPSLYQLSYRGNDADEALNYSFSAQIGSTKHARRRVRAYRGDGPGSARGDGFRGRDSGTRGAVSARCGAARRK